MAAPAVNGGVPSHFVARFQTLPNEASLPLARPRSRAYSSKRGTLRFELPARSVAGLAVSGAAEGAALVAAVACVLHRYSGEPRLCLGIAPPANTPPNALPLLLDITPDMSLAALLDAAAAIVDAMRFDDYPFSELI